MEPDSEEEGEIKPSQQDAKVTAELVRKDEQLTQLRNQNEQLTQDMEIAQGKIVYMATVLEVMYRKFIAYQGRLAGAGNKTFNNGTASEINNTYCEMIGHFPTLGVITNHEGDAPGVDFSTWLAQKALGHEKGLRADDKLLDEHGHPVLSRGVDNAGH